jgi:hypothetical protein
MDKTRNFDIPVHREGFALMITLSVLAVIIALTMVLLSYFTEVKEDADMTKALIQADVYYADITQQFKKLKGKQFKQLYKFPVTLQSPKTPFMVSLMCKPIATGINVNWLKYENDREHYTLFFEAQKLYDFLVQRYGIEEPDRLREMIMQELQNGNRFVVKAQSRLRQKNGIISYEQFADIIKRYQVETDDSKVTRVPWEHYFSFSPTAQKIDIDSSSPELIAYLFDIDLQSVREWFALPPEEKIPLKRFIDENGGNYAEKEALISDYSGESSCMVRFAYGGGQYRFGFDYIQGEAKHFEFYGKH